jgi:hypothetical protein
MSSSLRKLIELNTVVSAIDPHLLTIERWDELEYGSCAMHPMIWACLDAWFMDAGLKSNYTTGEPVFDNLRGLDALYKFFDIGKTMIDMICMAKHYPDPDNVRKIDIVTRISHVCLILEMELQDA